MFRLKKISETVYQIHSKYKGAFEGSLNSIVKKAVEMGVDVDEVETALVEMMKNDHKVAEFGMFGSFMWSSE